MRRPQLRNVHRDGPRNQYHCSTKLDNDLGYCPGVCPSFCLIKGKLYCSWCRARQSRDDQRLARAVTPLHWEKILNDLID